MKCMFLFCKCEQEMRPAECLRLLHCHTVLVIATSAAETYGIVCLSELVNIHDSFRDVEPTENRPAALRACQEDVIAATQLHGAAGHLPPQLRTPSTPLFTTNNAWHCAENRLHRKPSTGSPIFTDHRHKRLKLN